MSLIGGLTWRRQFRDGQSAPFGLCPNLPMRSICSHAHSQFQTADVVLCCPANLGGFSAFIPRSVVFLFLKYPEQVLTRVRKKQIGGQEIGSTFQLLGHHIDRHVRTKLPSCSGSLRTFPSAASDHVLFGPFCQFQSGAYLKIESKSNTVCGMKQARR